MNIPLSDYTAHVSDIGNGFPLIMLHGNGENLYLFNKQIEYFSTYYRVIAVDTRGHGKSTRGNKKLDFNTLSNDVIDLLDFLSIDSAYFLGFSDGGNTLLYLALKAPQRISSMILVGANLFPSGMKNIDLFQTGFTYAKLSMKSLIDKESHKEKEYYKLMLRHPNLSFSMVSDIDIPTLVIAGSNDVIKEKHTRGIAEVIKGARLEIIPDGSHFVLFEQPDFTNQLIMDFLRKSDRSIS